MWWLLSAGACTSRQAAQLCAPHQLQVQGMVPLLNGHWMCSEHPGKRNSGIRMPAVNFHQQGRTAMAATRTWYHATVLSSCGAFSVKRL